MFKHRQRASILWLKTILGFPPAGALRAAKSFPEGFLLKRHKKSLCTLSTRLFFMPFRLNLELLVCLKQEIIFHENKFNVIFQYISVAQCEPPLFSFTPLIPN